MYAVLKSLNLNFKSQNKWICVMKILNKPMIAIDEKSPQQQVNKVEH